MARKEGYKRMGYTLVARFHDSFYQEMDQLLADQGNNKIPYGRNCDRNLANSIMKYHMTIAHWAKECDASYLPKVVQLDFSPFSIYVTGSDIMQAEDGSSLLFFRISAGEGFYSAMDYIQNTMSIRISSFWHITIAVSRNQNYIGDLKRIVDQHFRYPFELTISGMDLYHIWKPVRLEKHISAVRNKNVFL